jgi:tricorn protease
MPGAAGRCRAAEFSGDSRSVLAMCDYSGELELWRFAANGLGTPSPLTRGASAMRQSLAPSPDGRWAAHTDKEGRLFLTDLRAADPAAATREIDRDLQGDGAQDLRWSSDGQALAYVRNTGNPWRAQLMLYTMGDGQVARLSSERYESAAPAFSTDGQWLYFLSRRHFAVGSVSSPWGDRNMGPSFERGWRVYALALQPGLRFPYAPPDELQPAQAAAPKKTEGAKDAEAKRPAIVTADLAERLYELPLPPGNYSDLRAGPKRLWWLDGERDNKSLKTQAIEPEAKTETLAEQVQQYALSADGKKLMLKRRAGSQAAPGSAAAPEILIVEAAPKLPAELDKARVRWSDWQIATDPRAEWRQMFADAWRMQRDFFYDKDMHGVDWAAVRAKYAPLVERITERGELSELLAQMVGELGALHSQVVASDVRKGEVEPGLAGLGARLERAGEGWRIAQIYRGDPELPSAAAPLAAPGLNIAEGSVITAINGRAAAAAAHPAELLRGQAGQQVLLQLREPGGRERQVIVLPVDARRESQLRLDDWRYGRARAVNAASQGRIGYLHLRAMSREDIADFAREFYAQIDREGLIIDVRHNDGGNIDSWILEKLLRRAWVYWQSRSPAGSPAYPNMQQAFRGQVVVLANEDTYSDGETFTEGFKRLGLGPVIGATTSGAGVWLSDQNRLMDNGLMRAAENGQMLADGRFIIEGRGVSPDIAVDNPPRASAEGRDDQLDAALAYLQKAMADHPMAQPRPGPYPRPVQP